MQNQWLVPYLLKTWWIRYLFLAMGMQNRCLVACFWTWWPKYLSLDINMQNQCLVPYVLAWWSMYLFFDLEIQNQCLMPYVLTWWHRYLFIATEIQNQCLVSYFLTWWPRYLFLVIETRNPCSVPYLLHDGLDICSLPWRCTISAWFPIHWNNRMESHNIFGDIPTYVKHDYLNGSNRPKVAKWSSGCHLTPFVEPFDPIKGVILDIGDYTPKDVSFLFFL